MIGAGFPVPAGFTITTEVYRKYILEYGLQFRILAGLRDVGASLPASLEVASQSIQACFAQGEIPPDISEAVCAAYRELGGSEKPVAVRSSATAEDLPEASFAGQQETYLNIAGIEEVLVAVKKCWASLWTARAIAYRMKNHIDPNSIALAVVVQEMVNAEATGVLFTANPVSGKREEMVINAAWGLGEAIVGGLVSPDTIIADKATGKIKQPDVAEKTVITIAAAKGTEEKPLVDTRRKAQVLNEAQVTELVNIARKIEDFYAAPQDIEWCRSDGRIYILQSRPITALPEPELPPPTEWKLPKGAYALMRNNIVELMADPLSPLFSTLGLSAINRSLPRLLNESFGMRGIMPPDIIIVVNQYAYNNGSVSPKGMARLLFGAGKIMKMMFTGAVERWTETGHPRYIQTVENWQAKNWRAFSSVELIENAKHLTESAIDAYAALVSGVIPAAWITEALFTNLYNRLIKHSGDLSAPVFLLGYDSLPIRADKSLYSLADWVRLQPQLAQWLDALSASQIASAYRNEHIPKELAPGMWQEWHARVQQHLREFGHTIYDLDFIHPVPADDPAPVFDALKLYLSGAGANPYLRQSESAARREQAALATRQRLRGLRLKWFNKYLASAQKYAPLREDGLAQIGLAYPLIRQMLLEVGQRFAQHQVIPLANDIYWLTEAEALSAAGRLDGGLPLESLTDKVGQH